ncbi:hypothetical protein GGX14DRAFT_578948 [Mycena pura]|uniref:Uncharacterized protein n=1 Tax=Mycena pura TaxID=153505 RepID=A0AAD6USQ8_9AGAR|nr:hypothetical protein GGX14DRAFT_578948 [Mycena pura]
MVNLTAIALAGTLFSMIDFQGHALNLLFGQPNDGTVVIGENMLDPVEVEVDQVWALVATTTSGQFTIMNPFNNKSLSYAGGLVQLTHAQATVNSIPRAFNFILAAPPQTFNILDVDSGMALTAWTMSSFRAGGDSTPVTYEFLELGAIDQMWTLVTRS